MNEDYNPSEMNTTPSSEGGLETYLYISPKEYTFTQLNELTSVSIETEDPNYVFERVNTLGTGLVELNKTDKTLKALAYGKANYRIRSKVEGKTESVVYLNFEIARPMLGIPEQLECYADLNKRDTRIPYTPPTGYRIKLIDTINLETPIAHIDNDLNIIPDILGDMNFIIVLEKENPEESERGVEYIGAYLQLHVYELVLNPKVNGIYLKLNQNFNFTNAVLKIGKNNDLNGLQLRTNYSGNEAYFNLRLDRLDRDESLDIYNQIEFDFTIQGLIVGNGQVEITYHDQILHSILVDVFDIKSLTIEPDIDNITLRYGESFTFSNIQYNDNDTFKNIIAIPSLNHDFDYDLHKSNETENIYELIITNNSEYGGSGTILLKDPDTTEGSKEITIKCLKQVKEGEITLDPVKEEVNLNVGRSFTFSFISATEADDIVAEVENPDLCQVRIEELGSPIMVPGEDGTLAPKEFPQWSVQKVLYIIATHDGETSVLLKGIVNGEDVSSTYRINVKILPADKLPDETSIMNLYAPKLPKDKIGDVIINLPEESATLVLKEKLDASMVIEFGYSYDYIEDHNPDINTNPTAFSTNSGNPTWYNQSTNELFICVDNTENKNVWKGDKGTQIGKIVYPNPGEKGFGVGPAPLDLVKLYNLQECEGCWDRNSDNYGNYYDAYYNKFVFIPVHCIIPIVDTSLSSVYPYDGMKFKFSWEIDNVDFTRRTIPRCFINKGKIQAGIFISKYNGEISNCGYINNNPNLNREAESSHSNVDSLYPVYKTGNEDTKERHYAVTPLSNYPELVMLSKAISPQDPTQKPALGRHNMTLFIQTMLSNLGDLHTIASYEKSASYDVCKKLKYLVSGTWVRETECIQNFVAEKQVYKQNKDFYPGIGKIKTEKIHFNNGAGSIKKEYKTLFSHNGQECGVFDLNGPANVGLTGILIVQDNPSLPNNYKIYSLKEELDIAEIEQQSLTKIRGTNTKGLILKTPLFNLDNYVIINHIRNNEEISSLLYLNPLNPYITHDSEKNSLLKNENYGYYININAGLNTDTLNQFDKGHYSLEYDNPNDYGMKNSKFKSSVFNMSYKNKINSLRDLNEVSYGFFTVNYTPTDKEAQYARFNLDGNYNGYRTRVGRFIGQMKYLTKNNSEYLLGYRVCITPAKDKDYLENKVQLILETEN